MPLGTSYIGDTVANHSNGTVGNLTPAQVTATYGSGNVKTASRTFSIHYNGHVVTFPKSVPVVVDAKLAAYLTAGGYPVS